MKSLKQIKERYNKFFNDEEKMFKIEMGLKFLLVSFFCMLSVLLFTYLLSRIDVTFFVAHGFPGASNFKDAIYEYIYSSLYGGIIWVFLGACFIFALGYYLSSIMIRPFKAIAFHCEERLDNRKNYYTPDFFSDLKLLTSFSVFFFQKIDEGTLKGKLGDIETPPHFMGVHKPQFEANFFFNYFFIIVIFSLLSSLGIILINTEIQGQVMEFSRKFLSKNQQITYFLEEQFKIADIGVYFFVSLHLILYLFLGLHLYAKVATPAFAVFATMRSFLRGNYHNRVHLIGFYYLRNDCRKINKYLDHVQKNLT